MAESQSAGDEFEDSVGGDFGDGDGDEATKRLYSSRRTRSLSRSEASKVSLSATCFCRSSILALLAFRT
jgi:hypothetical protein